MEKREKSESEFWDVGLGFRRLAWRAGGLVIAFAVFVALKALLGGF